MAKAAEMLEVSSRVINTSRRKTKRQSGVEKERKRAMKLYPLAIAFVIAKYSKARALVYFASNDRFKTSAESRLVTITMVADRAAPKTRSLSRVVMILLILAMKVKLQ